MNKIQKNQRGFAHIFIVLIALVLVIGGVFAAFRFVQDNNSTDTAEVTETENQSASVKIKLAD